MNLVYITSVSIPSLSAQSKQILSNSKTMSNYFKEFKLISPSTNKNRLELDYPFWEKKDLIFKKGKFKYLEFAFRSIFFKIKESNYIYTRDILIALIFKIKKYTILYESHQKPKFFAKNILRLLKHYNLKIVVISYALKSYYLGELGYSERNILVAHDGVFLHKFNRSHKNYLRNKYNIKRSYKILLHTGSPYFGRGIEFFKPILDKYEKIIIFHVGGDEIQKSYWNNYINNKRFYFLTHIDGEELIQIQKSCDFLLFPMTRETKTYWCCSPMKLFEYMATGKPIIASYIGSIVEILNNENSIIFEPTKLNSLFYAIDYCLKNPKMIKHMGLNAKKLVAEKYTWDIRVKKIIYFIKNFN